jgi:diguanylate cyclase (GGDEF)-like protein/putative nucleotidyltransferase with HDIG domain
MAARRERVSSDWANRISAFRGPVVLLAGIWVLGLVTLAAVVQFERRVDETRRAQVVIAQMRNQQGALLAIAFDPVIAATATAPAQTALRLAEGRRTLSNSVATLDGLGNGGAPARIGALSQTYFNFIDHLSTLVARGASPEAALALGASQRPGGIGSKLALELERADAAYDAEASNSRTVAAIGTVVAIVFLLVAFSITFSHVVWARRRSQRDATTDALTDLGNRRKLFADMEDLVGSLHARHTITVGIFDLDGFKAYNDIFGHPAGDALLRRLARRLTLVVGDRGGAYRIGGDEFVVITAVDGGERLLASAQAALSEDGPGYSIGCSIGSTRILAGVTLEQALHEADQRLYTNKRSRSSASGSASEVRAALLQVLAEQDAALVAHLEHVAALAARTAAELGLPAHQVEMARRAAELHDVGKAAIPAEILDKTGPLDPTEMMLMKRHSAIGARIVAAAPTLAALAPIVRAAHERADGTGYPDGLLLEDIPVCSLIIAVVDAYDAMTSDRPYRTAMSPSAALAELHRHAGTQFDPQVVDAFTSVLVGRPVLSMAV